jgi:hypothetical protein
MAGLYTCTRCERVFSTLARKEDHQRRCRALPALRSLFERPEPGTCPHGFVTADGRCDERCKEKE